MASFLIPLISGLAGGLLNRPSTQQQSTNQNTTQQQSGSTAQQSSSAPVYDPFQLQMRNYILNSLYNRSTDAYVNPLVDTTINQGINQINASAAPQQQALAQNLAARGLSYSGSAGTAEANAQANRIGQITNLNMQRPLLQDQLKGNNLTSFAQFLSSLPVGSQTSSTGYSSSSGTSNTNGTGTVQNPGNILGGALSGLGSTVAYLYGKGAYGGGG